MQRMIQTSFVAALVCALCLAFGATQAHAQFSAAQHGFNPPVKPKDDTKAEPAPPPALPGATSNGEPAEKTTLDLAPNEALFDAINRGDLASARDALSRGADLNARNILGMTPIDLSVDLSRNDITFLLLSLRATATPGGPPATAAAAPLPAGKPGKTRPAAAAHFAVRAAAPPPVALPPAPRQYAGPSDPGTPNPQVGFLGFGRSVQ